MGDRLGIRSVVDFCFLFDIYSTNVFQRHNFRNNNPKFFKNINDNWTIGMINKFIIDMFNDKQVLICIFSKLLKMGFEFSLEIYSGIYYRNVIVLVLEITFSYFIMYN